MKQIVRRVGTIVAGFIAAFAFVAAGAAPASAVVADHESPPIPVESLSSADQSFLASAQDFWCTLTINYPHASGHVSGTINVTGSVSCPVTMTEMFLQVHLQKSTGASWAGPSKDLFNTTWLNTNAATSCSSGAGSYRGRAYTEVRPPAGWSPAMQSQTKYSPYVSVACGGGTGFAAAGDTDGEVELLPDGSLSVSWPIQFVKDSSS